MRAATPHTQTPHSPCKAIGRSASSRALGNRSGKGRKASTHQSLIREHIAAVEIGYAANIDEEPAARALLCRRRAHETFQRGAGV